MKKEQIKGVALCSGIAALSYGLGEQFPTIGGAVFSLLSGMIFSSTFGKSSVYQPGIAVATKKVLQLAVVFLGFGLDILIVLETGRQSLPILLVTILSVLGVAYLGHRYGGVPSSVATLVGVGTAICGGSAIAATAPVIDAEEEEVAQAISVIFIFNVLAALLFPILGKWLGFPTTHGNSFGLFAGTAINDTSSVTAAASTWDSIYGLGSQTLDVAVMVKLTRTLAIIPVTVILAFWRRKSASRSQTRQSLSNVFPRFILLFLCASLLTTLFNALGVSMDFFKPLKSFSKFLILVSMAGIGLKTNLFTLFKEGKKAFFLGLVCWVTITFLSLFMQKLT